jgi:hypothetical protein
MTRATTYVGRGDIKEVLINEKRHLTPPDAMVSKAATQ